jgi:hypothetical protein
MVVGEVKDHLVVFEGTDPVLSLPNIALDEVDSGGQGWRAVVGGWRQVVQDRDLVALLEQELRGSLTDEAGSTGDQHLHSPETIPDRNSAPIRAVTAPLRALHGSLTAAGISWVSLPLP